ncbi:OprD family outer membrane porin [bacterium]|nr:OprD family outer membrane porin [bacterium]MBU1958024.1 OprD family outer membrane porin [bacterium]
MKKLNLLLLLPLTIYAQNEVKQILKPNSTVVDVVVPTEIDALSEMLSEGIFYGRLRSNNFYFDWEDEVEGKTKDHYTMGIGGSLSYKSAYLKGLGFTTGLYTTQNPLHMSDDNFKYYKVGKGVMSRYNVATRGEYGLTSLAQAYVEYKDDATSLKVGRQIFESYLTKSNDIKMIPNTFEGVTVHSKVVPNHNLKLAYLSKQKLRDHSDFHHLFAYQDDISIDPYANWLENDDTAMHQGITVNKLKAKGIDDRLLLFEIDNGKKNDFSYMFNYTAVPELFASSTVDMSYKFLVNDFTVAPALRYMHQFDYGAGKIGGANLKTKNIAYTNPDSVESDLYGARVDVAKDKWQIRTGFSKVADKADIISPWRAFPTNGFGYTLLQYNWYANTTCYVMQGDYDFTEEKLHVQMRLGLQDFDDDKSGVQADSNVYQLDFIKQFEELPNFYTKLRMVFVRGDDTIVALDGSKKLNPSYNDVRVELNYLF